MAARFLYFLDRVEDAERQNNRRQRIFRSPCTSAFALHDVEFSNLFRLPKVEVHYICESLREELTPISGLRTALSVETKVLCALRFYATGSYQKAVGQDLTLALSQTSVSNCITSVSKAINKLLLKKIISFPREEEYPCIKRRFAAEAGFRGVIGVIDCTHVAIIAPPANDPQYNEADYVNRKGYHSINVQIVCNWDMKITNVNAKFPGCTHDSFIWKQSLLREILQEENSSSGWLLGDSGYPLELRLLTPVLQATPSSTEFRYNRAHAKTRSKIERCIGLLKSRFRCLLKHRVLHYSPNTAANITNACCVLHNICVERQVEEPEDIEVEVADDDDSDEVDEPSAAYTAAYTAALQQRQRFISNHFSAQHSGRRKSYFSCQDTSIFQLFEKVSYLTMGGGARDIVSIEIPLVHVQQHLTWDCGVSAVMMVLNEKDREFLKSNLDIIAEEEGFNKSTWTIDLSFLLHKFGVNHLYSTVTLGVNPGYTEEDFYLQVLQKDANRINEKFQLACNKGVNVVQRSVGIDDIVDHLSSGNPAIVLVNANLLFCDTCSANKCLMQILSCCQIALSYQGHYVVLCGFNKREKVVLYRNPTYMNRVCTIPYDALETARKSFGTDEDVLFIHMNS